MVPSVGRVVHYVARGSADGVYPPVDRMAHVTEVGDPDGPIGLCIVNPTGLFFRSIADGGCLFDPAGAPGTWHWPPRVEAGS